MASLNENTHDPEKLKVEMDEREGTKQPIIVHIMIQIWRVGLVGLFFVAVFFCIAAANTYGFGHSVAFSCLIVSIVCLLLFLASFLSIRHLKLIEQS